MCSAVAVSCADSGGRKPTPSSSSSKRSDGLPGPQGSVGPIRRRGRSTPKSTAGLPTAPRGKRPNGHRCARRCWNWLKREVGNGEPRRGDPRCAGKEASGVQGYRAVEIGTKDETMTSRDIVAKLKAE